MLFKEIDVYLPEPTHAVQINTELVFALDRIFFGRVGGRALKKTLSRLPSHIKFPVIFHH